MRRKCGFCLRRDLRQIPGLGDPADIVDRPVSQADIAQQARVQGLQFLSPPRVCAVRQPEIMSFREKF